MKSGVRSGVGQVGPLLNVYTLQVPSHLPHLPHTHTCAASGDLICVVSVICATSASLSNSISSLVNATKLSKLGTAPAAAAPGFADARLTPPGAGGVESVEAEVWEARRSASCWKCGAASTPRCCCRAWHSASSDMGGVQLAASRSTCWVWVWGRGVGSKGR